MKLLKKSVYAVSAFLLAANVFWLGGCGKEEEAALRADGTGQYESLSVEAEDIPLKLGEGGTAQVEGENEDNVIAPDGDHKTKEEWDEEDRQKRAMLEEEVQAAGGISEEEAIEIGQEAMATDMGERGKDLTLLIYDEEKGWNTELCVADWSEIKEVDRGEIAYCMQFSSEIYEGMDLEDMSSYHCTVSAVDGRILEAYEYMPGEDWDKPVYYEH